MNATEISKYEKRSTAWLRKKAQIYFNAFIRQRDKEAGCISCGGKVEQAGHFYSSGHFKHMTFNEDNCWGQCIRCNYFLSGNLIPYRANLEKKIGTERLKALDTLSRQRGVNHLNRFFLIEILNRYKK
jgi:hypothetical protein